MAKENRKRMIINSEVQFDLLAFLALSGVSFMVTQSVLLLALYSQIYEILPFVTSEELISRYAIPMLFMQVVPLAVSFLVSAIYFNKLTNQIVGPVYRIKKTFENALRTNKFTPIVLRDGDYFRKEVEAINDYMNKKAS